MRGMLVVAALVLAGWIVTGTVLWFVEHGDPTAAWLHFWTTLRSDWMLIVLVTDMLVFTTAAFVWVAFDLRGRDASRPEIIAWLAPMLLFGSAVLLVYLARRARRPTASPGVA
jgi:hypothetical protein